VAPVAAQRDAVRHVIDDAFEEVGDVELHAAC
jgi:hypothetical protein